MSRASEGNWAEIAQSFECRAFHSRVLATRLCFATAQLSTDTSVTAISSRQLFGFSLL
jgi:hypothetical protein